MKSLKYTKNLIVDRWVNLNKNNIYTLMFDGNCLPNPGNAVAGFVIKDNKEVLYKASFNLGKDTSNNEAEYCAFVFGLIAAVNFKISNLIVLGDSNLVINQMKGVYKVNANNLLFFNKRAETLCKAFKAIEFKHHTKNNNYEADDLANQARNKTPKVELQEILKEKEKEKEKEEKRDRKPDPKHVLEFINEKIENPIDSAVRTLKETIQKDNMPYTVTDVERDGNCL